VASVGGVSGCEASVSLADLVLERLMANSTPQTDIPEPNPQIPTVPPQLPETGGRVVDVYA
jgi:hypothetical protein